MPPLSAPADRYRYLVAEIAYYAAAPVRKGGKTERKRLLKDLRTMRNEALKAACKEMYAALDERGRRLVHAEMKRWYARNKKYPKLHGGISQNCDKIQI